MLEAKVVAEALRAEPAPGVVKWLDAQLYDTLYLGATCAAALHRDFSRLPKWQRETRRGERVVELVMALFEYRVLPFDGLAVRAYDEILQWVRRNKYSIGRRDGMAAAIAKANGMKVACRDESPFLAAGLTVTNPWLF